ncbi:MAG: amino acid ABC transporter permease [Mesorhizobium amorphae]|nr:MAG: amino acid ABC transporter permease [Mesorhizobium amorphae]
MSAALDTTPPPPAPRPWTGARIAGVCLVGFWALAGLGFALYMILAFNPELFARYWRSYLSGLWVTLVLVALSFVLGAVLSAPIAYARNARSRLLSVPAYAYVYFFRGSPLLAQIYLIYYGLGSFRPSLEALGLWTVFREPWNCALLALTLNSAAYQTEILRGAVRSVARGQWEGAAALGLDRWQTLRKVVLPQALIVALRPYGNEIVLLIKGSAVVAIITVFDLMGETRRAYSRSFDFQTYLWAAILYLAVVEALRHGVEWIERRLTRHLRR